MNRSAAPRQRLIFLLTLAERSVRNWIDDRGRTHGVTAATAGALMFVAANPGTTMSQLSGALRTSAAGTSGLLSRMEASGLIVRALDESDHRVTRITLTEFGARACALARASTLELNSILTAGFDESEQATIARWLQHVADALGADRSDHAGRSADRRSVSDGGAS